MILILQQDSVSHSNVKTHNHRTPIDGQGLQVIELCRLFPSVRVSSGFMAEPIDSTFWEFAYDIVTSDSLLKARRGVVAAATTKRKKEEVPRMPRNVNEYPKGDIRLWRLDPATSPWWQLINRPGVDDVGTLTAWCACRRVAPKVQARLLRVVFCVALCTGAASSSQPSPRSRLTVMW